MLGCTCRFKASWRGPRTKLAYFCTHFAQTNITTWALNEEHVHNSSTPKIPQIAKKLVNDSFTLLEPKRSPGEKYHGTYEKISKICNTDRIIKHKTF